MNDDYLWNKTGEPDPEVEKLEQILGVLRYQPKKLVLPDDVPMPGRRNYFPLLAIAAMLILGLLAAGVWFGMKTNSTPRKETAKKTRRIPASTPASVPEKLDQQGVAENKNQPQPAPRPTTTRRRVPVSQALIAKKQREREEALAAKEQLLFALRLASEKLNQAQRRTQLPALPNQSHNQHKIG